MIKTTLIFNGKTKVELTPENEHDKILLALAFNGNSVKSIGSGNNGEVILTLETAGTATTTVVAG